jgi:hypothetical protein
MGERVVACAITREAPHDIDFHHGFRASGQELVRAFLPQLERLAKVKFRAGRIEENGELPVRSVGHASLRGNPWPSMKPLHLPICYDKFEVADGLSHGDRIGRRVHAC